MTDRAGTDARGLILGSFEPIDVPPPRRFPWDRGSATGIGSLPGTDIVEAVTSVFGEFPDLPHLPELPDRGAGADMVGRTAGLLVAMPVELYVGEWRIASHPGHDARRTRDLWDRDLDTLVDVAADFDGLIKLQAAGAWTMAASLDLPVGGRMLRDQGAVRDLVGSLAEGLRQHVADVRARLPRARVLLQLDEPSLPAVLAGRVPTESGFDVFRAVDEAVARAALTTVIVAAGVPVVVHCCAPGVPIALLREAGATGIAIDLDLLTDIDPLGEALDAGTGLFAGAVATGPASASRGSGATTSRGAAPDTSRGGAADVSRAERFGRRPGDSGHERGRDDDRHGRNSPTAVASNHAAERIRALWKMLGFSPNDLAEQVVVTPACGLAGLSVPAARQTMAVCREAARRLADA